MAEERPFMPPPPRELRDLPPRPAQPQPQKVEDNVQVNPFVEISKPEESADVQQVEKQEGATEKKKREKRKINKKPFYWFGFFVSVAAAIGLIILFFLNKQ